MQNGACRSTVFRMRALQKLGHEIDVIWTEDVRTYIPFHRSSKNVNFAFAVLPEIRRRQATGGTYDVVQIWSGDAYLYGIARRFGFLRNARPLMVSDTYGVEHLQWTAILEEERLGHVIVPRRARITYPAVRLHQVEASIRLSDCVICHCEIDRKFIVARGWVSPDKIIVIPHGVSPTLLQNSAACGQKGRGLLFVGTWDPGKGIRYLVEAYERALLWHPDLRLSVVGCKVPAAQVLAGFSEHARSTVRVVPALPEEGLREEYAGHDIFVFPSLCEGFGTVFLEAMAYGLAVVGTPVGGMPDIVVDDVSGLLVPLRNSDALAAAISRVWVDGELRRELGSAAQAKAAGYSWDAVAPLYDQLYRNLQHYGTSRREQH
jgi:glycosyltransferase involved in cell wall biosynthesis